MMEKGLFYVALNDKGRERNPAVGRSKSGTGETSRFKVEKEWEWNQIFCKQQLMFDVTTHFQYDFTPF